MDQNWIIENINNSFATWNTKLSELWTLATTSPQAFKGGAVWGIMQSMEGAVVVLACIIYSGFVSTPIARAGEPTSVVWSYLAESIFNMLVLVGLIKGSDRIIHEMLGL